MRGGKDKGKVATVLRGRADGEGEEREGKMLDRKNCKKAEDEQQRSEEWHQLCSPHHLYVRVLTLHQAQRNIL